MLNMCEYMTEGGYDQISLKITIGIDYIIYINKCEEKKPKNK